MLDYNFRLSDLHAAIGLAQMNRLAGFTEKCRANAAYLNAHPKTVVTLQAKPGYGHVWHQYTICVDGGRDRDAAVKRLNDAGGDTGIFYPVSAHQPGYMKERVGKVTLPVAERLAKEVISLLVHSQLAQADLETIVQEVNKL